MSHSFRQPLGPQPSIPVSQTPLPGRMVAPICTTGSPAVYSVMPNAYGLLTQQPQQYIAQPMVYQQPLTNVQNRIPFVTAVPSNVPRMFVPVTPVATGISPSSPDPTKVMEEHRRLEKERNFQLQQERLKQFTVGSKKSSINADNLIDSMFGKLQPKRNAVALTSGRSGASRIVLSTKNDGDGNAAKSSTLIDDKIQGKPSMPKTDNSSTFSGSAFVSARLKKDTKGLESMMLECSNLNAPSKASKFSKLSVKEITPSSSHTATFTASEKARDWSNIKGLDSAFIAPKQRFPNWCDKERVPDLYKMVQAIVTTNDLHAPDTSLLFPIFMSSGLPSELLCQIWESVNESASGQLTIEEMHAALALIAVAQAGHPVQSVSVLHKLPSCPVPQLSYFTTTATPSNQTKASSSLAGQENVISETESPNQPFHKVVRPTAISIAGHIVSSENQKDVSGVTQGVADWTPFADSSNTPDDEFDDFKSATPTAINFSLNTPSSDVPPFTDDDFDDFKQAPCAKVQGEASLKNFNTWETAKQSSEAPVQDLMSPEEDKYGVFRSLQQADDSNQWGDFTFSSTSNDSSALPTVDKETGNKEQPTTLNYPSVLITESTASTGLFKHNVTSVEQSVQEDDFGDFVHARVPPPPPSTTVTDFADFSNFKQSEPEQAPNDEFGEFTSCVPASLKPESGHDFFFHHVKDNISLAESQSVSSLELGTFDGGGNHSGESKSSLSRQGSIPSLDLKSVGLDGADSEDCFGEMQLSPFVPRNSKSPSPVSSTKGSDENEMPSTHVGQLFQPSTLPLTDKYSVIRQEKTKDEDQHLSCWICCLQNALDILENTKQIFNQMSCSSVCNEVLASEEGGNYVKNVIEVYKIMRRIGLASKSLGKQTDLIINLLKDADRAWHTMCGFFAGTALMPEDSSLDFSSSVLRPEPENNAKACGLCLLNIDLRSKSFKQSDSPKISYGGRNYHSTCANFWVNCVDPLLPALVLPQLL